MIQQNLDATTTLKEKQKLEEANNSKNDVVNVVHMLSHDVCKMTSLVNKSTDWPPNYHKILIFSPPKSVKRSRAARIDELADSNKPAMRLNKWLQQHHGSRRHIFWTQQHILIRHNIRYSIIQKLRRRHYVHIAVSWHGKMTSLTSKC